MPLIFEAERRIYASVNYTIIDSDNGLSPGWPQAIIGTHAGTMLNRPLETNFREILIEIYNVHSRKCKCRLQNKQPFCLSVCVLIVWMPKPAESYYGYAVH